jgi:fermentation-respiration switch protein FrsA (DUF1100 family)
MPISSCRRFYERQPLLIIQGRLDRLIPWEQAQKIVNAVGKNAELAMFENGNQSAIIFHIFIAL